MAGWDRKYPTFADWLGERLARPPYSQAWLADKLNLKAPLISDWCNGKKGPYRAIQIALIAKYLNTDPVELAYLAGFKDVQAVLAQDASLRIAYSEWPTSTEFITAMPVQITTAPDDRISS